MIRPNVMQKIALRSLKRDRKQGLKKALIVLPSGIGKTYLSVFDTRKVKGKILYIAHRDEILQQAKESFKKIWGIDEEECGSFNRYFKDVGKKLLFASVFTLSKKENLKLFRRDEFEYIIVDEHHHSATKSYDRLIRYFKPKFLLGMTATPYRTDGMDVLRNVGYNLSYSSDLVDGIKRGLLVPFNYYAFLDNVDYSKIKLNGHNFSVKDLNRNLIIDSRDDMIIKEFKEMAGNKQTIGFCCSVKHAKRCAKKFNDAGIESVAIDWHTRDKERRKILNDFKNGLYQVIFTIDIFNEGVDIPQVEALLFLRPTMSKNVFFQQLGRGLRTYKNKKDVLVLDFIGNYKNSFKARIWLKEIMKKFSKRRKHEIVYDLPSVKFDRELVDLWEYQKNGKIPRQAVIEAFNLLREKLKRKPTYVDLEYSKYSNFHNYEYMSGFGNFEEWTRWYKAQ